MLSAQKLIAIVAASFLSIHVFAQAGYVKLENDSTLPGYVRFYTSAKDGHRGIELWKTKTDKKPRKIPFTSMREYAVKKDTFVILQHFKPFHDTETYFDIVEARVISRGRVSLLIIDNYQNPKKISAYTGGGLVPVILDASLGNHSYMYVMKDKASGNFFGLPSRKEKLREALLDYFPEKYIDRYREENGELVDCNI